MYATAAGGAALAVALTIPTVWVIDHTDHGADAASRPVALISADPSTSSPISLTVEARPNISTTAQESPLEPVATTVISMAPPVTVTKTTTRPAATPRAQKSASPAASRPRPAPAAPLRTSRASTPTAPARPAPATTEPPIPVVTTVIAPPTTNEQAQTGTAAPPAAPAVTSTTNRQPAPIPAPAGPTRLSISASGFTSSSEVVVTVRVSADAGPVTAVLVVDGPTGEQNITLASGADGGGTYTRTVHTGPGAVTVHAQASGGSVSAESSPFTIEVPR